MKESTNVRNFPMRSWWKDHSTGKIYYVVGVAFDVAGKPDVRELQEVGAIYDPFKPQLKHITDLCELFLAGQLTEYVNKP